MVWLYYAVKKKELYIIFYEPKNYANWPVTILKQVATKGAMEKLQEAEV